MPTKKHPTKPNPVAMAALAERLAWFLAQREQKKRSAKLRGRNRAALMKV